MELSTQVHRQDRIAASNRKAHVQAELSMSKEFDITPSLDNFFYSKLGSEMASSARQRKIGLAAALAVLAAAVGGLLIGLGALHLPPAGAGLLAFIILVGVFLATLPRWRRLDHMQQDSRLICWYWGGSFGSGLALIMTLVLAGVHSRLFEGAALVWLLQFMGYALARLCWWTAHRPEAA